MQCTNRDRLLGRAIIFFKKWFRFRFAGKAAAHKSINWLCRKIPSGTASLTHVVDSSVMYNIPEFDFKSIVAGYLRQIYVSLYEDSQLEGEFSPILSSP